MGEIIRYVFARYKELVGSGETLDPSDLLVPWQECGIFNGTPQLSFAVQGTAPQRHVEKQCCSCQINFAPMEQLQCAPVIGKLSERK